MGEKCEGGKGLQLSAGFVDILRAIAPESCQRGELAVVVDELYHPMAAFTLRPVGMIAGHASAELLLETCGELGSRPRLLLR